MPETCIILVCCGLHLVSMWLVGDDHPNLDTFHVLTAFPTNLFFSTPWYVPFCDAWSEHGKIFSFLELGRDLVLGFVRW